MIDKNNLYRVRGILSARMGAEIPKYDTGNKIVLPAFNPSDPSFQQWRSKAKYASSNSLTAWRDYSILKSEFPNTSVDDLATYMESGVGPGGVSLDSLYDKYTDAVSTRRSTTQQSSIPGANASEGNPNAAVTQAAEIAAKAEELTQNQQAGAQTTSGAQTNQGGATISLNGGVGTTDGKTGDGSAGVNILTPEQIKEQKKNAAMGIAGNVVSGAVQAIGSAVGQKQMASDSDVTKGITTAYDTAANIASNFGPVGQAVGTIMNIAKGAGDIIQELGGGTDQQTTIDKIMDSPLFSWNIGMLNGFAGKNSDEFGLDTDTLSKVGSSYGGTSADLQEASDKAGKKYGLFSSKKRKETNEAIAQARLKQSKMANIADDATDDRLLVQSMGQQKGLANSIMFDGGYSQKYTYAAKEGGILEWNPAEILEWEPQIELNWELPVFKEGGNIDIVEELEWVPEFKSGNKIRTIEELIEYAKKQNPRFIQRLSEEPRGIKFIDDEGNEAEGSHYLESRGEYVVPRIQEIDGELKFLSPQEAIDRAMESGNYLEMTPEEAILFAEKYKQGWPDFFKKFKKGGSVGNSDVPEIEETTQKNVIPEGALHKNKHHMEHAEGLTKKGIPVIDEDREQQAEIEHSEIIFTLEVTKKLEEYYEIFYSEESSNKEKEQAAIDAGKLLVYQILENTEDRTGLIESCKKGGTLTLKTTADDLIEEVLSEGTTIVMVEGEDVKKKPKMKEDKVDKELMKEAIKEALIELLIK